ncbi:MAG: polyphosphate polymerase domain-containing protein [Clostridia bacterium]|nr:polyphosphate polymerase domain-containing protein [Clostridia bacterium]
MNNHVFQRYEAKFLVNRQQRILLEQAFADRMAPDPYGESTICNIYYDTPDFRLIRHSLEKPIYKEKLRVRSYGPVQSSDMVFLELKKKYNGIVYKRRTSLPEHDAMDFLNGKTALEKDSQIAHEIMYFCSFYQNLEPKVHLSYDRSAYFSQIDPSFRVTFDQNIRWRQDDLSLTSRPGGESILQPGQSLCEIKAAAAIPLWLVEILNKANIRQTSFSKYGRSYQTILMDKIYRNRGIRYA